MANNIEIILVAVDLLSLKLLIFRLIISYFGSLRMHQTAPLISFFLGEHTPYPIPQVSIHILAGLIFIYTLKNADQIYTYLMKLKLNTRIGLIIIVKMIFYDYQK